MYYGTKYNLIALIFGVLCFIAITVIFIASI